MSVLQHMVYWSFETKYSIIPLSFFLFDTRIGQSTVKLGPISKFEIILHKHVYLLQFCLRTPKNEINNFHVRQSETPIISFKDVTMSPLLGFLTAPTKKDSALKFCAVLFACSFVICISF